MVKNAPFKSLLLIGFKNPFARQSKATAGRLQEESSSSFVDPLSKMIVKN